jgi:DNA-binding ferritin-like protein (Dps family)
MKNELKQTGLFKRLKHHKITVKQYINMYLGYTKGEIPEDSPEYKILKSIDELFVAKKKMKLDELMGMDYSVHIDSYIEIFPTQKLPNGKYARGNKKNIETNFRWFFENYNYSWQVIHDATEMYVSEYRAKNYLYMRTAMYFIRKDDGTRTVHSDLADYCDKIVNDQSYTREKFFRTKIL